MKKFIYEETNGRPIKHWTEGVTLDDRAREQLHNIASLPFIHKHVAAMPDVHWGMGATIGSVVATKGAVVPAAVGVDIGCGMCAVKTSLTNISTENIKAVLSQIRNKVPLGFKHHKKKQAPSLMPNVEKGQFYPADTSERWLCLLKVSALHASTMNPIGSTRAKRL